MGIVLTQRALLPFSLDFSFNTAGITSNTKITTDRDRLPLGSKLLLGQVVVQTAFNASTNNLLRVGITPGGIEFGVNIPLGTVGVIPIAVGYPAQTAIRDIWLRADLTGTAATEGRAHLSMMFEYDGQWPFA